jgi:hypothetical protein
MVWALDDYLRSGSEVKITVKKSMTMRKGSEGHYGLETTKVPLV